MKLKFILLFLLLNCLAYSQNSKLDAKIDEQEYQIDYPKNWKIDTSGKYGISFCLYVGANELIGNFGENINLMIQDIKSLNLDIDKYTELSENQIRANADLIESKRIRRNDLDCQQLLYEATLKDRKLKFRQYYFIKNGKAYVLTFTATKETYDKYIEISEKVMSTFIIK